VALIRLLVRAGAPVNLLAMPFLFDHGGIFPNVEVCALLLELAGDAWSLVSAILPLARKGGCSKGVVGYLEAFLRR
jgi:hypothetical protein